MTRVLIASAEAAPFAKVGGLGDVIGSLPAALQEIAIDARVVLPAYGFIDKGQYSIERAFHFTAQDRHGPMEVEVFRTETRGIIFYFVAVWPFFGSDDSVYTVREWDIPRFVIFNRVVMHLLDELAEREGWRANILHAHDWHMALLPFLISLQRQFPRWRGLRSALSIHNIEYQGDGVGGWYWDRGLHPRHSPLLTERALVDNQLAIGIAYADFITTVSPTYSREIQHPSYGHGLDDLLRARSDDLYGILNGIDTELYNPALDDALESCYDSRSYREKRPPNKALLQRKAGLAENDDIMLIGIVSRLVWQKGLDLAIPALRALLADSPVQLVILGDGDDALAAEMQTLADDFARKAYAYLGFNAEFAQQIYAGCDVFLMPSRYEPCGIGQMVAMRYGALPIVRETGGLSDTVSNYDNASGESGTGFVFLWEQPLAIERTLRWALKTFQEQPAAWCKMQLRAMERDFSWCVSAAIYADLYRKYAEDQN